MLLLATDEHLQRLLALSKAVFMDGTFKVCPALYFQLFTLRGLVEEAVVFSSGISSGISVCSVAAKMHNAYFDMISAMSKMLLDQM